MSLLSFSSKLIKKLLGKADFCSAVIAAAGSSQRMDGEDKLFSEINGKPVLAHTLIAFENSKLINEIIIVTRQESLGRVEKLCEVYNIDKVTKIIVGGQNRTESVLNGVTAVSSKASLTAIHDAARPCVSNDIIEKTINAAAAYKAAAPGVPITSTVKKVENGKITETVNRDNLVEIQTPQVFDSDLIKGALTFACKKAVILTDDCMAVEAFGVNVHVTKGSVHNIKITSPDDLLQAETIFSHKRNGA